MRAALVNVRFEGNNGHDADVIAMFAHDPKRTFIINYYRRSSKGPALALTADVPTVTQDDAGAATQFVPART